MDDCVPMDKLSVHEEAERSNLTGFRSPTCGDIENLQIDTLH
jgi:hypothetical protein